MFQKSCKIALISRITDHEIAFLRMFEMQLHCGFSGYFVAVISIADGWLTDSITNLQLAVIKVWHNNNWLLVTQPDGVSNKQLVFVKDASLYFTSRGYEHRRREIVIASAKHETERSNASEDAIYKT